MIIRAALIASLVFLSTAIASAQAIYTTSVSVQSGNPLNALVVNDVITVDITLRTDGVTGVQGLGASANGYAGFLSFTSGQATNQVLFEQCFPSAGCFNGGDNLVGGSLIQTTLVAGPEVQFVTMALGAPKAANITGAIDPGVITQVSGDPQFQIIFTAIAEGSFSLTVGSLTPFGDGTILAGGAVGTTTNSVIPMTVPEPAAIASSLAAIGSVFAVVGIRRRVA